MRPIARTMVQMTVTAAPVKESNMTRKSPMPIGLACLYGCDGGEFHVSRISFSSRLATLAAMTFGCGTRAFFGWTRSIHTQTKPFGLPLLRTENAKSARVAMAGLQFGRRIAFRSVVQQCRQRSDSGRALRREIARQ